MTDAATSDQAAETAAPTETTQTETAAKVVPPAPPTTTAAPKQTAEQKQERPAQQNAPEQKQEAAAEQKTEEAVLPPQPFAQPKTQNEDGTQQNWAAGAKGTPPGGYDFNFSVQVPDTDAGEDEHGNPIYKDIPYGQALAEDRIPSEIQEVINHITSMATAQGLGQEQFEAFMENHRSTVSKALEQNDKITQSRAIQWNKEAEAAGYTTPESVELQNIGMQAVDPTGAFREAVNECGIGYNRNFRAIMENIGIEHTMSLRGDGDERPADGNARPARSSERLPGSQAHRVSGEKPNPYHRLAAMAGYDEKKIGGPKSY